MKYPNSHVIIKFYPISFYDIVIRILLPHLTGWILKDSLKAAWKPYAFALWIIFTYIIFTDISDVSRNDSSLACQHLSDTWWEIRKILASIPTWNSFVEFQRDDSRFPVSVHLGKSWLTPNAARLSPLRHFHVSLRLLKSLGKLHWPKLQSLFLGD